MTKRENEIYLQILELIEKEYDKLHLKQVELKEEIEQYGSKKEITKTEIKKYFGDYKNLDELKKKGINYYSKLPKEIREYIKHAPKEIRQAIGFALLGKPVKILTGKEFQRDGVKLTIKVPKYYKEKFNGKVINKELGEVSLDLEGVKDDIAHGVGAIKASAFIAVPEVIMYGKIFSREKKWKSRNWNTFVIIAPIKIGTVRYIEEVIIKNGIDRQGLYLHEVEIKKRLEDFIKTYNDKIYPLGHLPISKLIIAQKISKVNKK
ncbi:hypothetical protein [Candidatus Ruminimicrobium bovinum]|uniref:hypothetical protein n=1 Tax=Candidatus Ruminimicrobium bovinum TaxID=3242779 RepID=UPI0039B9B9D0